jgi:hypothetical protein
MVALLLSPQAACHAAKNAFSTQQGGRRGGSEQYKQQHTVQQQRQEIQSNSIQFNFNSVHGVCAVYLCIISLAIAMRVEVEDVVDLFPAECWSNDQQQHEQQEDDTPYCNRLHLFFFPTQKMDELYGVKDTVFIERKHG